MVELRNLPYNFSSKHFYRKNLIRSIFWLEKFECLDKAYEKIYDFTIVEVSRKKIEAFVNYQSLLKSENLYRVPIN